MTREQKILDNIGLVHTCAHRLADRGVAYEELVSLGIVGLIKAVDGFDEQLGYSFSTYAVPTILGEMRRAFREAGMVKVSRAVRDRARTVKVLEQSLTEQLSRPPTVEELAQAAQLTPFETAELLNALQPVLSLTAYDSDGAERQLDIPCDSHEEDVLKTVDLHRALDALEEIDRKIIDLRYFRGWSQSKTAQSFGWSQVQISRRERKILLALRRRLCT